MTPRRLQAGITLLEVVIAVSLLAVLMGGVIASLLMGLSTLDRTNTRLMANRKVAGAQQALQQQLEGFMPVVGLYSPSPEAPPSAKMPFFQGEAQSMRLVSSYSLQEGTRGYPRILEFQVIPGQNGQGVRLVVNERLYSGSASAGIFVLGLEPAGGFQFRPIETGPMSFVLADRLAYCRFAFLDRRPGVADSSWTEDWTSILWPAAIRVEMGPLDQDISRLRPTSVLAQIHVNRAPLFDYDDYEN